jgi:tRNA modification GTPase
VSRRYLSGAHVVLACGDTVDSIEKTAIAVSVLSKSPVVHVMTKTDLPAVRNERKTRGAVRTSAVTSAGLDLLWEEIDTLLAKEYGSPIAEVPMLTRARHIRAINDAHQEILGFEREWRGGTVPVTVAAVHLRAAAGALEEMIGAISVDDVLDRVFSSFCVGK